MVNGHEESHSAIVAVKPTNNAGRPAAEPVERRVGTKGNATQHNTRRAQNRESVTQVRIPTEASRLFRRKPAGDSDGSQPPIPRQTSHP
jgi:hypothetical protein